MKKKTPTSVHFMGIGGSGMSAVACIAKSRGFVVSGCDVDAKSDYLAPVKKLKIPFSVGHSPAHLKGCDLLTVTPAVFYQNSTHPELEIAKQKNIIMTWQEFMSRFLHPQKKLICVSGTHGKSTTAAMLGTVFEALNLDPTVEVGATVKKWGSNFRVGHGHYFISEADEYYDNFLHYNPDILILNNIELDHPDYFQSLEQLHASFLNFIRRLRGEKILIFNSDHSPTASFITTNLSLINSLSIRLFSYRLKGDSFPHSQAEFVGSILTRNPDGTSFSVSLASQENSVSLGKYKLSLPGLFNVANSLGVIAACQLLGLDMAKVQTALLAFIGTGRRMEEVAEKGGIKILSDYAHHPTEISSSLEGAKQKYRDRRLWVIFQPHMQSRLKMFTQEFADSLKPASKITVLPVFSARDTGDKSVTSSELVKLLPAGKTRLAHSFDEAVTEIAAEAKSGDVIILMGAGNVYLLKDQIIKIL